MPPIYRLKNAVQPYAWGSRTAIAELLGDESPSPSPQAELWMGAHPKAPSLAACKDGWRSMIDVIDSDPVGVLGRETAEKFENKLPYLFKVLAADKPLSIQAHPNRSLAAEGFDRENVSGIPMDSPARSYKDPNHKPECLCALTRFWALKGFREHGEIRSNLNLFCPESCRPIFQEADENDIESLFGSLMTLDKSRRRSMIEEAVSMIGRSGGTDPDQQWIMRLYDIHPDDIGVLSPLFLNLVPLKPGQAIFLAPGEPHAYLNGTGIELMANSDNVLRGGLTSKHVDLPELMRALDFTGMPAQTVKRRRVSRGEFVYSTPAEEFELSVMEVNADVAYESPRMRSVEILLCTEGEGAITDTGTGSKTRMSKGDSFVVPAAAGRYILQGRAVVYKAAVPV